MVRFALCVFLSLLAPWVRADIPVLVQHSISGLSVESQAVILPYMTEILYPVIKGRMKHVLVRATKDANIFEVLATLPQFNRVVGRYMIEIRDNPDPRLRLGLPNVVVHRGPVANSSLVVPKAIAQNERFALQNQTRSMVRADGLLHPHSPDLNGKITLSTPQALALNALLQYRAEQLAQPGRTGSVQVGTMMPVAMGKSEIIFSYLERGIQERRAFPQLVVISQNVGHLDDMSRRLRKRFNLKNEDVTEMFQDGARSEFNPRTKVLLATRSIFNGRKQELFRAGLGSRQIVLWIDEAHHIGRQEGEFEAILNEFQGHLKTEDEIVYTTATFWHEEDKQIVRRLQGYIYGGFLTESEQGQLRAGVELPELSRRAAFRAIAMGYLAPLDFYHAMGSLNPTTGMAFANAVKMARIADPTVKQAEIHAAEQAEIAEETEPEDVYTEILRGFTVDSPFIISVAKSVRENFIRDPSGAIVAADRGVIFAPTKAHANIFAALLNERMGGQVQFRPYHSGAGVRKDTLDWFRDENATTNADQLKEKTKHKYIVVVGKLDEAIDIPEINAIYVAKNVYLFKGLLQIMGRGLRIYPFKTGLRVFDYSGALRVFFRDMPVAQFSTIFARKVPNEFSILGNAGVSFEGMDVDVDSFSANERLFLHRRGEVNVLPEGSGTSPFRSDGTLAWNSIPVRTNPPDYSLRSTTGIRAHLASTPGDAGIVTAFYRFLPPVEHPFQGQDIGFSPEDKTLFLVLNFFAEMTYQFNMDPKAERRLLEDLRFYFSTPQRLHQLKTQDLRKMLWVMGLTVGDLRSPSSTANTLLRRLAGGKAMRSNFTVDPKIHVNAAGLADLTEALIIDLNLPRLRADQLRSLVSLKVDQNDEGGTSDFIQDLVSSAAVLRTPLAAQSLQIANIVKIAWLSADSWFLRTGRVKPTEFVFVDEGRPTVPFAFANPFPRGLKGREFFTYGDFLAQNPSRQIIARIPKHGSTLVEILPKVFAGIDIFNANSHDAREISAWLGKKVLEIRADAHQKPKLKLDACEEALDPADD